MIFRGTGPHGGTQAIAPGEPDDTEKRINLILYPRKEFVNRTLEVLSSHQLADYSFFSDGVASFEILQILVLEGVISALDFSKQEV